MTGNERTTVTGGTTRQPARVIIGHCPVCGRVVILENHFEVWPPFQCRCGWFGATGQAANHVRYESNGVRK